MTLFKQGLKGLTMILNMVTLIVLSIVSFTLTSQQAIAKPRILIIGDSLTEGYGVSQEASYPTILESKLRESGLSTVHVVNAGTSGATSAFGLRTLRFQIKHAVPDYLILALGANDGLRGISPDETERNLDETIKLAKENNISTILVGMMAPPNYGRKFPDEFKAIYPRLADRHKIPLIPFLLEGVAGEPEFNLDDGIHPNEKGYLKVAEYLFGQLRSHLK